MKTNHMEIYYEMIIFFMYYHLICIDKLVIKFEAFQKKLLVQKGSNTPWGAI